MPLSAGAAVKTDWYRVRALQKDSWGNENDKTSRPWAPSRPLLCLTRNRTINLLTTGCQCWSPKQQRKKKQTKNVLIIRFLQTEIFSILVYYFVHWGFAPVYICVPLFSHLTGFYIFNSIMELELNWCTSSNWDQSHRQPWTWPVIRGLKMKMMNVLCCHYHAAAEHPVCAAFLSLHLYVQQEFSLSPPPPHNTHFKLFICSL